jgi:hypothetical protein
MKIVSCQTADSKPVKQEVNSTVILSDLVFPGLTLAGWAFLFTLLDLTKRRGKHPSLFVRRVSDKGTKEKGL